MIWIRRRCFDSGKADSRRSADTRRAAGRYVGRLRRCDRQSDRGGGSRECISGRRAGRALYGRGRRAQPLSRARCLTRVLERAGRRRSPRAVYRPRFRCRHESPHSADAVVESRQTLWVVRLCVCGEREGSQAGGAHPPDRDVARRLPDARLRDARAGWRGLGNLRVDSPLVVRRVGCMADARERLGPDSVATQTLRPCRGSDPRRLDRIDRCDLDPLDRWRAPALHLVDHPGQSSGSASATGCRALDGGAGRRAAIGTRAPERADATRCGGDRDRAPRSID